MANCLLEDTGSDLLARKSTLNTVYIYSKYCNLKCRHCWINPPYSDMVSVRDDEAPLDDIISALEECRPLGLRSVKLTGGEPFTRKDIFELLRYLKDNKLGVNVESNGTLIRQAEAKALKEAACGQVGVSLDGPNEAIHSSLRGVEGSFGEAIKGIKALKKEAIKVQVIISLWKGNSERIRETISMLKPLGVDSIKINPINQIERAELMQDRGEVLSVKETIEFYNSLSVDLAKDGVTNVTFDIPPAFQRVINMRFERLCTCGIFNILGILGDGRISICGIGSSRETLVLGRIGKDRIKDIWENHPVLKEIRASVPAKLEGVCARCMMKKYCLGKCRAEAYYSEGSLLAPLGFCQKAYDEGLFPGSRLS